MKPIAILQTILVAGVLVGCGASVNPQLKASIDARVAHLQPGGPSFGPPETSGPPALHVGDWVRYRDVSEKNENSIITLKIVGQQGNAWWIENCTETYYGRTVTLLLADLGDRTDPDQMSIERAFLKFDDDPAQEQPPHLIGMMSALWKPLLAEMTVRWDEAPQEDAAVPGGSFARAYHRRVTISLSTEHRTFDAWLHPAVPIHGSVKSIGIDYKGRSELIGFGNDATSEIGVPAVPPA
jgi:hypothetical protein